jgi:hypothetical protein
LELCVAEALRLVMKGKRMKELSVESGSEMVFFGFFLFKSASLECGIL